METPMSPPATVEDGFVTHDKETLVAAMTKILEGRKATKSAFQEALTKVHTLEEFQEALREHINEPDRQFFNVDVYGQHTVVLFSDKNKIDFRLIEDRHREVTPSETALIEIGKRVAEELGQEIRIGKGYLAFFVIGDCSVSIY